MAKAPIRRGSTAATASCGEAPRSTSRATRWPTTSVSVSLSNLRPSAISSSRSGLKFSMMPLWTSAIGADDVRVGVADRRRAVRRPAGVGDAGARRGADRSAARARDCRACPRRGGGRAGHRGSCRCRRSHSRDIRAASARRTAAARHRCCRRSRRFRTFSQHDSFERAVSACRYNECHSQMGTRGLPCRDTFFHAASAASLLLLGCEAGVLRESRVRGASALRLSCAYVRQLSGHLGCVDRGVRCARSAISTPKGPHQIMDQA